MCGEGRREAGRGGSQNRDPRHGSANLERRKVPAGSRAGRRSFLWPPWLRTGWTARPWALAGSAVRSFESQVPPADAQTPITRAPQETGSEAKLSSPDTWALRVTSPSLTSNKASCAIQPLRPIPWLSPAGSGRSLQSQPRLGNVRLAPKRVRSGRRPQGMRPRLTLTQPQLHFLHLGAVRTVESASQGMVPEGRGSRLCARTAEHRELLSTGSRGCLSVWAVGSAQPAR